MLEQSYWKRESTKNLGVVLKMKIQELLRLKCKSCGKPFFTITNESVCMCGVGD